MHNVSSPSRRVRATVVAISLTLAGALAGCSAAPSATTEALEQAAQLGSRLSGEADTLTPVAPATTGTAGRAPGTTPPRTTPQAKASSGTDTPRRGLTGSPAPKSTTTATPQADEVVVSDVSTATPANSGTGRRIIYSISQQRVWLVEAGERVVRTYRVSGRLDQPGPGTFSVFSKSRNATSAVAPPATMRYMVRFTKGKRGANIGFHDIPRTLDGKPEQTEKQLGEPLSAGCVRQKTSDAIALWNFAPVGTKVVVTR